jgi:uncharacterized protein (DUF427 family)
MDENKRGSVRVEPSPKRVRAYLAGHLVADTRQPSLVRETGSGGDAVPGRGRPAE